LKNLFYAHAIEDFADKSSAATDESSVTRQISIRHKDKQDNGHTRTDTATQTDRQTEGRYLTRLP